MAYKVSIIPGKNIVGPDDLDQNLKNGCDEVTQYGTNIYVCGAHGSGKSSVLEYFKSKSEYYFGIYESDILFMSSYELANEILNELDLFESKVFASKLMIIDDVDYLDVMDLVQDELIKLMETDKTIIFSGSRDVKELKLKKEIVNKIRNYTVMKIEEYDE